MNSNVELNVDCLAQHSPKFCFGTSSVQDQDFHMNYILVPAVKAIFFLLADLRDYFFF